MYFTTILLKEIVVAHAYTQFDGDTDVAVGK